MNIIFILVFLVLIISLYYSAAVLKQASNFELKVDVYFFYICGWLVYGAYPILFCSIGDTCDFETTFIYSVQVLYAVVFWVLGTFLAIKVTFSSRRDCQNTNYRNKNIILTIFAIITVILLVEIYMTSLYSSFGEYLTGSYGNFNKEGINSLTSSIPFIITGLLIWLHIHQFRKVAVIFLILFAVVFLIGGNRNIAMFNILALTYLQFRGRYVSAMKIIVVTLLAIAIASLIAVAREIGVIKVLGGSGQYDLLANWVRNLSRYTYSEFGVMYRHVGYLSEAPGFEANILYSYLISPIINLIPTAVWPSRPFTNSVEFTWYYWGIKGNSLGGLGFSPITEAIISAGYFFPFIFVTFGFSIGTLVKSINLTEKFSPVRFLLLTSVSAASLNFFRIDFAIYLKFIFLTFVASYIFLILARLRLK